MATDYFMMTVYLFALTVVLFTARAVRGLITPIILSIGMLVFYLLDAFFPYGSIGPLQFWANSIVACVGFLAVGFPSANLRFQQHSQHQRGSWFVQTGSLLAQCGCPEHDYLLPGYDTARRQT